MDKTDTFDFGTAIQKLKAGGKVARSGWNGKGMHLYLTCAMPLSAPGDGASAVVIGEPCVVMFTAQGKYQPGWLASQADMLAEDWTDAA